MKCHRSTGPARCTTAPLEGARPPVGHCVPKVQPAALDPDVVRPRRSVPASNAVKSEWAPATAQAHAPPAVRSHVGPVQSGNVDGPYLLETCRRGREVVEWPYTIGGGALRPWTPPPLLTKGTIVGQNEVYHRENLVGPFVVHNFGGDAPPPPSLPFKYGGEQFRGEKFVFQFGVELFPAKIFLRNSGQVLLSVHPQCRRSLPMSNGPAAQLEV